MRYFPLSPVPKGVTVIVVRNKYLASKYPAPPASRRFVLGGTTFGVVGETRRAPSRHCGVGRVNGHTMHEMSPPPQSLANDGRILSQVPPPPSPFLSALNERRADHTTGLYKSFSAGTIYTSRGTANLITELMGVNPERVVALPMNKPVVVAGFELTLLDANHCPAAVM